MAHKPLIRPKVKVKDRKEYQKRLKYLLDKTKNCYVQAGITNPEEKYPGSKANVTVGQVAAWMEFGTHTREGVTNTRPGSKFSKRHDDAHWGIEVVPARSFIRTPVDEGMDSINRVKNRVLEQILDGKMSIKDGLDAIGVQLTKLMKNAIVRGIEPELRPSTLAGKRALGQPDTPLVATGFMFDHIDYHTELDY